jgi:hypothetical protein
MLQALEAAKMPRQAACMGGGLDFTYWFPWKYAGMRFQGAGASISGGGGSRTKEVTVVPGFAPVSVTGGGGSEAAGIMTGDFLMRLPLDDFWPDVHWAPYGFVGLGSILLGGDWYQASRGGLHQARRHCDCH